MTSHAPLRIALGLALLGLAAGSAFLARSTEDAARAFRGQEAAWQRGLEPAAAAPPGLAQRAGEAVLGVRARSDVLRAYRNYRAGLADVIPGTAYPQTRARFEAIETLERLRASLRDGPDRASADVVLGVILTDAASSAGPQRDTQLRKALAAFVRAVREDPANTTAKLDLEVLLEATTSKTKSQARPSGSTGRRRQSDEKPRNPTAPARGDGEGF